jgi:hypothetical protein
MATVKQGRFATLGPVQFQQVSGTWRCTSLAWTRGKWRPFLALRFGQSGRTGQLGIWLGKDQEDERWTFEVVLPLVDFMARLHGPWGG